MKNAIVITNVDSLLGYGLAYRFLEDWNREEASYDERRDTTEFRLLCHERQGLEDLERLGGKIFEMQKFSDSKAMNQIMKDVCYVMFVPENSEGRIEEGEVVINAAKNQNVDYITMFSYLGVDQLDTSSNSKMRNLKQFYTLEKQVTENFDKDSYCIVRSAMWHQFFYYLGPMIEDENKICLPIDKNSKWGSIDLADFLDAVYNISSENYDEETGQGFDNLGEQYVAILRKKNRTLFEFAANHNVTAIEVVKAAAHGLDRLDMTYEKINPDKMFDYLYSIHDDNRFRERPIQDAIEVFTKTNFDEDLARDRPYTFPLGRYLNKNLIQTLIEFWELIDSGKAEKTTDQLEKALHRKPLEIEDFFKRNRDQFRRLR